MHVCVLLQRAVLALHASLLCHLVSFHLPLSFPMSASVSLSLSLSLLLSSLSHRIASHPMSATHTDFIQDDNEYIDGRDVLHEAWHMHEPLLHQQLTDTLPQHMHSLLSIISDYARPSPYTYWQPVFAPSDDASTTDTCSRVSGLPCAGWDVVTGAVVPVIACSSCAAPLTPLCQLNLAQLPEVDGFTHTCTHDDMRM